MLLRSAREVGDLIADGRRRLRWSQFDLAQRAGVSRQWVSQVENGKTTVEFDLVLGALHALGYSLYAQSKDWTDSSQEDVSSRTPLTRKGGSLRNQRSQRGAETADG
jgi:y4mF family transcriptional regulator